MDKVKVKAITINVDASFILTKKVASYAYWLSSDYGHWKGGSVFNDSVSDPNEAEIKGIINALVVAFNNIKLRKINIEQIYINCDSDTAISVLSKGELRTSKSCSKYLPLYLIYKSILEKNNFFNIKFLRIKGHSRNYNARNYVNNWCDKEAKKIITKYLNHNDK